MRICHISWEFPPVVYGGLGRHVYAVAREQVRAGHDVVVISHIGIDADDATSVAIHEDIEGVRVIRVPRDAPYVPFDADALLGWVAGLSSAMIRAGIHMGREWRPDVVHAHDWLTAHAASALREAWGVPWIHTVHATEAGRHQGWLPGPLSRSIHSIEGWSVTSADRVIVCSKHMQWELRRLFDVSAADVIPNGVDAAAGVVDAGLKQDFRQRFGGHLIVHTGRLEWEKGAHTLIEALPAIRRRFPDAQCVIAGRGSQSEALQSLARRKRVASRVHFLGWLPDAHLRALIAAANVAVVPSIYEPFGIVALEAAVVGAPVVVARSGGLSEFVDGDRFGWSFEPGSARELATATIACLELRDEAERRARDARLRVLEEYGWGSIVERLVARYEQSVQNEVVAPATPFVSGGNLDGNLLFDVE